MKNYEKKSLIMGILAIALCWVVVGIIFAIIGVIFSLKGIKHGVAKKGKLYTGLILSIASIVIFILLVIFIPQDTTTNQNKTSNQIVEQQLSMDETKESVDQKEDAKPEAAQQDEDSENKKEAEESIEPNTNEMVAQIASEAKKSANESASEEKRDEAINFIYENYPDYFTDNDTMEKTMYYGYYLESAYAKNGSDNIYANLGMDTYQAVKYVYRNVETTDDDHVISNLKQIADALAEIGYYVETPESQGAQATERKTESDEPKEQMVWIPESGSKYHSNPSCSGMDNPTQVTISEAKSRGYTACKKCY